MKYFETLDDFIARLPLSEQKAIEEGAEELALEIEAARIKGKAAEQFGQHLNSLGASLIARLPSGREIDLTIGN